MKGNNLTNGTELRKSASLKPETDLSIAAKAWLAAFLVFIATLPTSTFSDSNCEVHLSFQVTDMINGHQQSGNNVSEILVGMTVDDRFGQYAVAMERFFYGEFSSQVCTNEPREIGRDINITIVHLPMIASERLLRETVAVIGENAGGYAQVEFEASGTTNISVVWNPRQMLRDQLLLQSLEDKSTVVLNPFERSYFEVALASFKQLNGIEQSSVDTQFPYQAIEHDLIKLFEFTSRNRRVGFDRSVSSTIHMLVEASESGYLLATQLAILDSLEIPGGDTTEDISGLIDQGVADLYQQQEWRSNLLPKDEN